MSSSGTSSLAGPEQLASKQPEFMDKLLTLIRHHLPILIEGLELEPTHNLAQASPAACLTCADASSL